MGTLDEDRYTFLSYLADFFLEWEMFQTKTTINKTKTHILWSITFFSKIAPLMRKCGKIF